MTVQGLGETCTGISTPSIALFASGGGFFVLSVVFHIAMYCMRRKRKRKHSDENGDGESAPLLNHSTHTPLPLPRDPSTMSHMVASGTYIDLDDVLNKSGAHYEDITNLSSLADCGIDPKPPPVPTHAPKLPPRNAQVEPVTHKPPAKHRTQKHPGPRAESTDAWVQRQPQTIPKQQPAYRDKDRNQSDALRYDETYYEVPITSKEKTMINATDNKNIAGGEAFAINYEIPDVAMKGNSDVTPMLVPEKLNFEMSYEVPEVLTKGKTEETKRFNLKDGKSAEITEPKSEDVDKPKPDVSHDVLNIYIGTREHPQQVIDYSPQSKMYATEYMNRESPPKLPPRLHNQPSPTNGQYMDMQFSSEMPKPEPTSACTEGEPMENSDTKDTRTEGQKELEESLGPPEEPAPPPPYVPKIPERRLVKK